MNSSQTTSDLSALSPDAVSYTMSSLVKHMSQCQRDQSRWFRVQAGAEMAHAVLLPRIVTCGAVVAVCCLALMSVA